MVRYAILMAVLALVELTAPVAGQEATTQPNGEVTRQEKRIAADEVAAALAKFHKSLGDCPECSGIKKIRTQVPPGHPGRAKGQTELVECPWCHGTGKAVKQAVSVKRSRTRTEATAESERLAYLEALNLYMEYCDLLSRYDDVLSQDVSVHEDLDKAAILARGVFFPPEGDPFGPTNRTPEDGQPVVLVGRVSEVKPAGQVRKAVIDTVNAHWIVDVPQNENWVTGERLYLIGRVVGEPAGSKMPITVSAYPGTQAVPANSVAGRTKPVSGPRK